VTHDREKRPPPSHRGRFREMQSVLPAGTPRRVSRAGCAPCASPTAASRGRPCLLGYHGLHFAFLSVLTAISPGIPAGTPHRRENWCGLPADAGRALGCEPVH
jgi:hypothetical protein